MNIFVSVMKLLIIDQQIIKIMKILLFIYKVDYKLIKRCYNDVQDYLLNNLNNLD